MRQFKEMNQVRIGTWGALTAVAAVALLFNLTQFAFLTGATTYRAAFSNAAGLQSGDNVRIAGAPAGRVRDMSLQDGAVLVTFDITEDVVLGEVSSAAIKTETVLGRKFLQVVPRGAGALDPAVTIPVDRTDTPYNITDQLGKLTQTGEQIDVDQLARSFDVIAETFADAPPSMREALDGLTRLSRTVTARDAEITSLLGNAEAVSTVLADRNDELSTLFADGNALLTELQHRRTAIRALLVNVGSVARQLTGLVQDNEAELAPTLDRFNSVLDVLRDNDADIAVALQRLGPFANSLGEAVASGPFWNAYVQNLVPGNLVPLPTATGAVAPAAGSGG